MKRLARGVLAAAAVFMLAGCPQASDHDDPPAVEVDDDIYLEDCLNREPDCGYRRPAPTPTPTRHRSGAVRPDQPTKAVPARPAARTNPINRR